MSFSSRLKSIRKSRKVSLKELADAIDVHLTQITRWEDESKTSLPSAEKTFQIADYLNVPIKELVFGTSTKESEIDIELQNNFNKIMSLPDVSKNTILELLKVLVAQHSQK